MCEVVVDEARPDLPPGLHSTFLDSSVYYNNLVNKHSIEELFAASAITCPICQGLPLVPYGLPCGHIGCESCLLTNLSHSMAFNNQQEFYAPCPMCRTGYTKNTLVPFKSWQLLAKNAYNSIMVKCQTENDPQRVLECCKGFTCEYVGSIMDLKKHKQLECTLRMTQCPNKPCKYEGVEGCVRKHFQVCEYLATYCHKCRLPVLWSTRAAHDCLETLKSAVKSKYMSNTVTMCNITCIILTYFFLTELNEHVAHFNGPVPEELKLGSAGATFAGAFEYDFRTTTPSSSNIVQPGQVDADGWYCTTPRTVRQITEAPDAPIRGRRRRVLATHAPGVSWMDRVEPLDGSALD
jgi:hypothetical protein